MKRLMYIVICYTVIDSSLCLLESSISRDITFYVYTKDRPDNATVITSSTNLTDHPNIKPSNPWKFLVHGWTTSPWKPYSPWFPIHKNSYFATGDYNVVYVDWSKPANQSYVQSALNARGSGKFLSELIINLVDNDVDVNKIHLLGHSLGSHLVGFAGKYVYKNLKEKIGRITATDPARPLFEIPWLMPGLMRLSEKDAEFVDIIHTDAGEYGMITSLGHVDYYPNGGKRFQPGCEDIDDINCSHARSTLYFGESINNSGKKAVSCDSYEDFIAKKCDSNPSVTFGEDVDRTKRGIYFFNTRRESPFLT